MKANIILGCYYVVMAAHLLAGAYAHLTYFQLSKVALMPLLLFWVYTKANGHVTLSRLLLFLALIASWIGDILLLYQANETFFLAGIGAFFVAQAIYSWLFYKAVTARKKLRFWQLLPGMIVVGFSVILIIPHVPQDLRFAVGVYTVSLAVVLTAAMSRYQASDTASFFGVSTGAALFVMSDTFIAINKFWFALPSATVLIMSTYCVAQYLIALGVLEHDSE